VVGHADADSPDHDEEKCDRDEPKLDVTHPNTQLLGIPKPGHIERGILTEVPQARREERESAGQKQGEAVSDLIPAVASFGRPWPT
jgi:hypothetical protein